MDSGADGEAVADAVVSAVGVLAVSGVHPAGSDVPPAVLAACSVKAKCRHYARVVARVPSSGNRGRMVLVQATGPTLNVLVRMDAAAEKDVLRRELVRALVPFVADVLENMDIPKEDLREFPGSTEENRCQDEQQ